MVMVSFSGVRDLANQHQRRKRPFPQLKSWRTPLICILVWAWGKKWYELFLLQQVKKEKNKIKPQQQRELPLLPQREPLSAVSHSLTPAPFYRCPHRRARRTCLLHVFIMALKKKISLLFALFSLAKVASALWKYESPWVILYFQRVKVLKSTSLFQRGGKKKKKSKLGCLKCSLGKGTKWTMGVPGRSAVPRAAHTAPESAAGNRNAAWASAQLCGPCASHGTVSSPRSWHDDDQPADVNIHPGRHCTVESPASTPKPSRPPPALPSWGRPPHGVWVLFPFWCLVSLRHAAACLPPTRLTTKYSRKGLGFRSQHLATHTHVTPGNLYSSFLGVIQVLSSVQCIPARPHQPGESIP